MHETVIWWPGTGSNRRHADFQFFELDLHPKHTYQTDTNPMFFHEIFTDSPSVLLN